MLTLLIFSVSNNLFPHAILNDIILRFICMINISGKVALYPGEFLACSNSSKWMKKHAKYNPPITGLPTKLPQTFTCFPFKLPIGDVFLEHSFL